ncbi:TonB-dependent receptor [Gluconacetobacter azotocaptans]|nr:TonB-dependent receptor [Gluconacetobacter azotocaptans]
MKRMRRHARTLSGVFVLSHIPALAVAASPPVPAAPAASSGTVPEGTPVRRPAGERIVVTGDGTFATANGRIGNQPGGGLIRPETATRSVSTLSADAIARQAPSASAFDMVALLPGANVSSSDPLGFAAQTNLNVRGLSGDSIGYVLEGMPLNDIAYYSGYPGQFADNENYDEIALAQGSADLDSPVLNASGGLMSLRFRDPSHDAGGMVDASYGSYHTDRAFARIDTGEIGHSGIRAFVSYSHGETSNWRGSGRDRRQHIDFKAVKEWGDGNRVSVLGTWNDAVTSNYPQIGMADWHAYGVSGPNNYASTYDPGNAAAGTDYWRLYQDPYRLFYVAAPSRFTLTRALHLSVTPYAQWGYGNAPGGTVLSTTGNRQGTEALPYAVSIPGAQDGMATVMADYTQSSYRTGFTSALDWRLGRHRLTMGYWYDYSDDTETQPFSPLPSNGHPGNIWADSADGTILLPDGRQLLGGDNHTISQVSALFVGDTMSFLDQRLTIEAGFKEVMLSRDGTNNLPGPQYRSTMNVAEPLPRLGARFQINPQHQIFASVSTNFRAPAESSLYDAYDPASGALVNAANTNLRNEYSISEEIGYRYAGQRVIGSVTFFNYNFTNRQIQTVVSHNGSLIGSTVNAGGQTSRGIDVEAGLRPWHHFSPYVSGEYLHATIDNDMTMDGDVLPTQGKTAVRSPSLQAAVGLTYDDGTFFGMASVKYVGHQYATFMNDERMPDHTTGNLTLGYRMSSIGVARHPEFRLNFINITDSHYLSGVANPTLNARDTTGRYGTTIAGEAPTYYVGGGFAVMLTGSSAF